MPDMKATKNWFLVTVAAVMLVGCASFRPAPLDDWPDPDIVQTQSRAGLTVSAGLLTDQQAAAEDAQPVR
jgi:uncharacterized protein YcfL